MANNRIYLVDTKTKEYLCLAKSSGCGWNVGNIDLYDEFMKTRFFDYHDKTDLIIGTENDAEFYNKWLKDGINFNDTNKWEYKSLVNEFVVKSVCPKCGYPIFRKSFENFDRCEGCEWTGLTVF